MITINFGKWSHAAGFLFIKQRIYINGYKWTPFVKVSIRYKNKKMRRDNILWGLGLKKVLNASTDSIILP